MSVHKPLGSVDLELAVILIMEDSMTVTVQMEQWPQEPILLVISHVLVSMQYYYLTVAEESYISAWLKPVSQFPIVRVHTWKIAAYPLTPATYLCMCIIITLAPFTRY